MGRCSPNCWACAAIAMALRQAAGRLATAVSCKAGCLGAAILLALRRLHAEVWAAGNSCAVQGRAPNIISGQSRRTSSACSAQPGVFTGLLLNAPGLFALLAMPAI